MNKKWSILLTVVAMAMIYLFLLVGLPALGDMIPACNSYNASITINATANWSPIGPALDIRPYREIYKIPLIIYLIPGIIGIMFIVKILTQKGEVKTDE